MSSCGFVFLVQILTINKSSSFSSSIHLNLYLLCLQWLNSLIIACGQHKMYKIQWLDWFLWIHTFVEHIGPRKLRTATSGQLFLFLHKNFFFRKDLHKSLPNEWAAIKATKATKDWGTCFKEDKETNQPESLRKPRKKDKKYVHLPWLWNLAGDLTLQKG